MTPFITQEVVNILLKLGLTTAVAAYFSHTAWGVAAGLELVSAWAICATSCRLRRWLLHPKLVQTAGTRRACGARWPRGID